MFLTHDYKEDKNQRHKQNPIERPSLKSRTGSAENCHIKTQIQKIRKLKH